MKYEVRYRDALNTINNIKCPVVSILRWVITPSGNVTCNSEETGRRHPVFAQKVSG